MAVNLIVEDGTGLSTSNSYLSLVDLKQYFDNFGYDYSTSTDDELSQYLIRSTRVIDSAYIDYWISNGTRKNEDQALMWPRIGAVYVDGYLVDNDSVPPEIENGTAEYVNAIISGDTIQGTESSTGIKKSEAVKVDVIETKDEYFEGSSSSRDSITAVDDALARLTGGTTNNNNLQIDRW